MHERIGLNPCSSHARYNNVTNQPFTTGFHTGSLRSLSVATALALGLLAPVHAAGADQARWQAEAKAVTITRDDKVRKLNIGERTSTKADHEIYATNDAHPKEVLRIKFSIVEDVFKSFNVFRDGPLLECLTLAEGPYGIETQEHVESVVLPLRPVSPSTDVSANAPRTWPMP